MGGEIGVTAELITFYIHKKWRKIESVYRDAK